jgi:hypothetical protein
MRIYLLGWLLILLVACKNNKVPEGILPEAKMRVIMWDMLRADEWISYEQARDTSFNRQQRTKELYQQVFQVNGITAAQFKKSFHYYEGRPELLKPLLDSLQKKNTLNPAVAPAIQ